MKSKSTRRILLAIAASSLMAVSSASAATYTWTQTATGDQDWTTAGNWSGSAQFVSDSGNELMFFADTNAQLGAGAAGASQVVINVPTSLSMNTLTLNGKGPNSTLGSSITIGTSASTWTIGDGTTSTVNLNSTLGGGGADRDLRYTIGANLTLVGNASGITTFTGASTSGYGATFSGDISGSGKGITKSGSSLLVFSGNNSYTGTTLVSGGVLRLSSATALSGGIGTTGGTSALTINGGVVELGATNFSRGLGSGSSQFQITGGTSGFSAYGGPRVVTVNGDASEELVWGSTYFTPTTLVLNQLYGFHSSSPVYPNGSIELANKLDLNGTTRTVQVNANIALLSNDIRTSTGTAGLTKTGAGMLVLTGNNSYNGTTTISAGTLSIGAAGEVGGSGSSNLSMNGGSLQIRGTALTSLSDLDSTVTFSNTAKGFDIQNASNTFTVDQVLSGTGTGSTLTKSGVGTLVLNQNNTFAGATTVTGGGKLVLDYTTNNDSKLSNTAGLTLSGTALVLKGGSGAGANHAEVVSSTTLGHYTSNSISRDGGSSTISLGALTTPGGNNMHTLSISEGGLATTTTGNATGLTNATGILGLGRVTVGSDFGTNSGGSIVAYSDYTNYTAATATGSLSTTVAQLTGGGTKVAGNFTTYALRIVNSGDDNVLELGSTQLLLLNNSTLLYAGGGNSNYTINGNSSSAISSASGNQPFVINTYAGTTLTVNTRTSSNFAPVSKAGAGTLVIGGNNPNLGIAYVQEGVLRVTHKDGLGNTTAGTNVLGGAALELANNIAIGAEALSLNGAGIFDGASHRGALRNRDGNNSWAGAITIGASGARINADASSSLELSGGIATTLTQDVTFGGAGNTTVSTSAISGWGAVIKVGAGTLTLSATNTYTGVTTITEGTLKLGSNDVLPNGSAVSLGTATLDADTRTDTVGTLNVTGSGTINLGSGAALAFADSSAGGTGNWAGTLNLVGFVSGSSLNFGSPTGLTAQQLAKISATGYSNFSLDAEGDLIADFGGGPGPLDHFAISAIGSPQTVGTPITGITITAQDASNQTVTSFTGTVTFSGSGGFSGTSASFVAGVLTGVSVTPTVSGSNLTLVVTDGVSGKTGSTTIATIQTQYQAWAGGAAFGADANGDGISNGLAFLLGASGPGVNALNKLPVPEEISGGLRLTFQMLPASARGTATLSLEHSNTLANGSWTTLAVPDSDNTVSDVVFTVTGTNPLNVTATIPVSKAADGKLFGRVKGVNP